MFNLTRNQRNEKNIKELFFIYQQRFKKVIICSADDIHSNTTDKVKLEGELQNVSKV